MSESLTGLLSRGEWVAVVYAANAAWQVPLVFLAAWIAARMSRRFGAAVEHRVWVTALLLEVGVPAARVDIWTAWRWVIGLFVGRSGGHAGTVRVVVGTSMADGSGGLRIPADVLVGLALTFVAVVIYFAARLAWGVWRTETMRRAAMPVVLEGEALRTWRRCGGASKSGLAREVEIRVSEMVSGPVTVGILRPAVLVPVGFLEKLGNEDLMAVLAHELAHVRRWDFAKNLVYEAISLAVAWHPVVWMTRARMAESREMVCDEMAAGAVSDEESYARSLLRLASMVADGRPAKTLHAIGIFDANSFERRVMNLTKRRVEMRVWQRMGTVAACAVLGVATCATAMALRVEVEPQVQAVAATGGGGDPLKVDVDKLKSEYKKTPVYPVEAKEKKNTLNGPVVLAVMIGKDGSVESIKIKKSLRADYDRSALESVKDWRWQPYLLNGEPVEVDTTVTVNYSLAPEDGEKPKSQTGAGPLAGNRFPEIVAAVDPVYPTQARSSKNTLDGAVVVGLTVNKEGAVKEAHIVSGLRGDYDESALTAVRQYRFVPALADGRVVEKQIQVEVDFRID